MAQGEHQVEPPVEVQGPHIGLHGLSAGDVGEHARRVVNGDDLMAVGGERVGEASRATTQD